MIWHPCMEPRLPNRMEHRERGTGEEGERYLEELHGIGAGRVGVEGYPPPWPRRCPSERQHNPMDSLVVLVTFSTVNRSRYLVHQLVSSM